MKRLTAGLCCVAFALGCGKSTPVGDTTPPQDALRADVLGDLVVETITPAHEAARLNAETLATTTQAWADSGAEADLEAAREAWRETMLAWQIVEVYRFGPSGAMGLDIGGKDLRDAVYSWPTTNPCRVDQELVEQSYTDDATLAAEAVNVRGLDAIEYLLFHTEPTNQCDPARSINADGSWAALSEEEVAQRRADYAAAAARGVVDAVAVIQAEWSDGFADEFAKAGKGSATFGSTQEALNAFSNAFFYIDLEVKDQKLATPAGLMNCTTPICPEAREFGWADVNFPAIVSNLDGFLVGFKGGEGKGFDDLLTDLGQSELSDQIIKLATDARDAAAAAPPMATALEENYDLVLDVHAKVKALTDLLKTQFIGVLDLELPDRAEGDND